MTDPRRRRWPWLLVIALLLLIIAFLLYGKLAPAPRPDGKGAAFAPEHRVAVLAALEGGWLSFLAALRSALLGRAGMVGRALRLLAIGVTIAGLTVAAIGGWLTWRFLEAEVHGTASSGHRRDWDD